MAADWLNINSTYLDSSSGGDRLEDALDGTWYWYVGEYGVHWFILDLGETHTISRVRGRSNDNRDPTDVDIFVSDDKESWGTAVATEIGAFRNTDEWQVVESPEFTEKSGRYVKLAVNGTEEWSEGGKMYFGRHSPGMKIFDVYGEPAVGGVELTPVAASAVGTLEIGNIVAGDLAITPSESSAVAVAIAPVVQVPTGLVVAPTPANAIAAASNPTVLGAILVIPEPATAAAAAVEPIVEGGALSLLNIIGSSSSVSPKHVADLSKNLLIEGDVEVQGLMYSGQTIWFENNGINSESEIYIRPNNWGSRFFRFQMYDAMPTIRTTDDAILRIMPAGGQVDFSNSIIFNARNSHWDYAYFHSQIGNMNPHNVRTNELLAEGDLDLGNYDLLNPGAGHDSFTDFVANEHIDWTTDQGATNIDASNLTGSPTFADVIATGDVKVGTKVGVGKDPYDYYTYVAGAACTADRILTLDLNDAARTFSLSGNLTVEGTSLIDQDLTADSLTAQLGALLLVSDVAYRQLTGKVTSSLTNVIRSPMAFRHTTDGDMADGFGTSLFFEIEDAGSAVKRIGRVAAVRDGADNEGKLQFMCGTNGDETFMTINASGIADIANSLTIDTINEHTAAAGVTIDSVILKDSGIGVTGDTDLLQLAANALTVNGTVTATGNVRTDAVFNCAGTDGLTKSGKSAISILDGDGVTTHILTFAGGILTIYETV